MARQMLKSPIYCINKGRRPRVVVFSEGMRDPGIANFRDRLQRNTRQHFADTPVLHVRMQ